MSSKSKRVAEKKLAALKAEIAANRLPVAGAGRTTVKTWADKWLPVHLEDVRPKTQSTDKGAVKKWIIPTLGHIRLHELAPSDVRALKKAIMKPDPPRYPKGRSSTTAGTYHRIFLKMLGDAVKEGHHIPESVLKSDAPKKAKNDRKDIPVDQAWAILDVVTSRDDQARWLLSFLTGMRQGEVLGLLVDRVDLHAGTLLVEWQLQHPGLEPVFPDGLATRHLVGTAWLSETKTEKGERLLHLGPGMMLALAATIAAWKPNQWGLMWVNERGLPIRDYDDRAAWKAIQAEAGVAHPSGRPWHMHEMRHTLVTMMMRAGVPDAVIAQTVGQSKLVKQYGHLIGLDAAPAITGVETLLLRGELIEGDTA